MVDIGLRALRTAIEKSMFVCFAIYSELERATLLFLVPTYSWMAEIFIRMFQNGSNKYIDVICFVAEKFFCSVRIQCFPVSASGKHPMCQLG